jgi:hypothetical protein
MTQDRFRSWRPNVVRFFGRERVQHVLSAATPESLVGRRFTLRPRFSGPTIGNRIEHGPTASARRELWIGEARVLLARFEIGACR